MRRIKFFAIFAAIVLFSSQAYAFTASYEQTTSGAMSPAIHKRTVKIKDSKIRMEMDTPEGKTIAIIEEDTMYSYLPSDNTAIKMQNPFSAELAVLSDYKAYLESLEAKLVGSENIGSYDCDIYEFIDPRINLPSKVWLWKSKNFPVKVEMKTMDGPITMVMENVKVGIPIDDSEFTLPKGVEIMTGPRYMIQQQQ